MPFPLRAPCLFLSLFTLMLFPCTIALAYDQSPEILGLHLGMSPAEAENIIRAQRPDLEIKVEKQFFTYNDGEKDLHSPEYVARIIASKGEISSRQPVEGEELVLSFSHEVENPRLLVIKRNQQEIKDPVGMETLKTTLNQKYGLPTSTKKQGRFSLSMIWNFNDGKKICYQIDTSLTTRSTEWNGLVRIPRGTNLSECAAQLVYRISGDPVKSIDVIMIDVEKIIESEKRAQNYIIGLEGKARQMRGSKGVVPPI